jgi:Sulfotransferase domain
MRGVEQAPPPSAPDRAAGTLPNLLIIGAAKAGTTSLHRYLDVHPSIFMSRAKELKLFIRDDWRDHLGWYRSRFPSDLPVRGESSPAYSMDPWWPSVPERVSELIPETRLIYMVRDPVERLVAQYVEMYADHDEHRPFEEALADYDSPSNRVVMPSRYAYQLDRWREHFPDEQILVLDQRELLQSRAATLRAAFSFLRVDPGFESTAFDTLHNERGTKLRANRLGIWLYERGHLRRAADASRLLPDAMRERLKLTVAEQVRTPALDPILRGELEAYLREDVERLRAYTGQPFAHWSV